MSKLSDKLRQMRLPPGFNASVPVAAAAALDIAEGQLKVGNGIIIECWAVLHDAGLDDKYFDGPLPEAIRAALAGRTEPENVRTGPPYDDPAFESLCREHGIWGTAASALCAVFWLQARDVEPIAWESATPMYTKYVTDSRYQKFGPKVRAWYRPYRCANCAALSAQPAQKKGDQ